MDVRMRELERRAAGGDQGAALQLKASALRAGRCVCEQPRAGLVPCICQRGHGQVLVATVSLIRDARVHALGWRYGTVNGGGTPSFVFVRCSSGRQQVMTSRFHNPHHHPVWGKPTCAVCVQRMQRSLGRARSKWTTTWDDERARQLFEADPWSILAEKQLGACLRALYGDCATCRQILPAHDEDCPAHPTCAAERARLPLFEGQ